MPDWLRRAGSGESRDGDRVVWSVAEGRRGRRWREVVTAGDGRSIRSSLLLELDSDGRFSHLELATASGLLTLHPEGDGTLHGNAVTTDGIRHVAGHAWDRDAVILVDGSIVCAVVAASATARATGALTISLALELTFGPFETPLRVAGDAVPDLARGRSWPLEQPD